LERFHFLVFARLEFAMAGGENASEQSDLPAGRQGMSEKMISSLYERVIRGSNG
jgi:hypothetical protein